jgi:hypothetical protein
MTTPTDAPKPTRWRRQQLEMRLRKGPPPGAERRGAKERAGDRAGGSRGAGARSPSSGKAGKGAKGG